MAKTPKTAIDIFNEMTKDELIKWIKSHMFYDRPKKSWLYFTRWELQSKLISDKQRNHTAKLATMGAKKRDEYARQFNAASDLNEKLRLANLMKPYHDRMKAWFAEGEKLDAEQKRVDALYERIEEQRMKEYDAKNT